MKDVSSLSLYTNINVQSFRRRRQRRSHRRGSGGRDGASRAVRFIREYRNLESLWWEEERERDDLRFWETCVCIQISKSSQNDVWLLREREYYDDVLLFSLQWWKSKERENTLYDAALSLSLSAFFFFFSSLCFRAFFLSLFFKSYEGEDGKKNEARTERRRREFLPCA